MKVRNYWSLDSRTERRMWVCRCPVSWSWDVLLFSFLIWQIWLSLRKCWWVIILKTESKSCHFPVSHTPARCWRQLCGKGRRSEHRYPGPPFSTHAPSKRGHTRADGGATYWHSVLAVGLTSCSSTAESYIYPQGFRIHLRKRGRFLYSVLRPFSFFCSFC